MELCGGFESGRVLDIFEIVECGGVSVDLESYREHRISTDAASLCFSTHSGIVLWSRGETA